MTQWSPVLLAQVRGVVGVAAVVCLSTLGALVGIICTRFPANHVAVDIRLGWVSAALALVAGSMAWRLRAVSRPLAVGLVLLAALTALAVWGADQWNLVVAYEPWLERGQPVFGAAPAWWR